MIINGINYDNILEEAKSRLHSRIYSDQFLLVTDFRNFVRTLYFNGMKIDGSYYLSHTPHGLEITVENFQRRFIS